jgi:2-keto-3-deoxy-L-rhamnonate aldolase RhmA
VDALFIGTSDLSFSLGLRGDQGHPKLLEAVAKVVEAGRRNGKAVGRPAATPEKLKEYMEQGFRLFQGPTDLGLLTAGAQRYLEPLAKP